MTTTDTKSCCALAYESEVARWLMGESYHPGGLALTERLGARIKLKAGMRVLDVACGRGASALHLAGRFECEVVGVDLSAANVEAAGEAARPRRLEGLARFELADAERLPFEDGAFDAVICECAFCLFPDKATAAREIARVLRPGGTLGFTDLVRHGELAPPLEGLAAWVACIADAQPLASYIEILASAGLDAVATERHDAALAAIADQIRGRLLYAEALVGLGKLWPGFDFPAANAVVRDARDAISEGRLGYALIVADKALDGR